LPGSKGESPERCLPAFLNLQRTPPPSSLEVVVPDWKIFVRITGLCCAKYVQRNQSLVDKYVYPLGKCVLKAFLPTDWKFSDHNDAIINIHPSNSEIQEFLRKIEGHVSNTEKQAECPETHHSCLQGSPGHMPSLSCIQNLPSSQEAGPVRFTTHGPVCQ
jgi:hypothetical protein